MEDIGGTLSWSAVKSFVSNLDSNSAMMRHKDSEYADFVSSAKTNVILADIYDILASINANLCAMGSYSKAQKPIPYPRPHQKAEGGRSIGKGALPRGEIRDWINKKRGQK